MQDDGLDEKMPQDLADALTAWSLAANCVLYERDPGPALLNVGSADEPRYLPRTQAWRDSYARFLLERLDADHARTAAAHHAAKERLAHTQTVGFLRSIYRANREDGLLAALRAVSPASMRGIRLSHQIAVELCARAGQIITEAGADSDDVSRRRLLAATRHGNTLTALGAVPGVAEDSTDRLVEELDGLDDDPRHL
ncbi:hypothetical protein ACVGVM_20715 [Pseudonocardia bannensis]|uniref:Uncharacterized protein n=1 Tax=Pseudonocardia bannensis TaxID=630973 RepID=A0A848DR19_9PSEU|nr:hypothetical protein [Pseudonocardia bannensis]NMH95277.1 hypothetical protein [Pseudonocardia bannensis]